MNDAAINKALGPLICAHGQLGRQCPQCDDAAEIARLRALLGRIRQWDALDTPDTDGAVGETIMQRQDGARRVSDDEV